MRAGSMEEAVEAARVVIWGYPVAQEGVVADELGEGYDADSDLKNVYEVLDRTGVA